jgi:hypothetical protein
MWQNQELLKLVCKLLDLLGELLEGRDWILSGIRGGMGHGVILVGSHDVAEEGEPVGGEPKVARGEGG